MNNNNTRPIAEGLFTGSDSPALLGSRCAQCREHFFPAQTACSNCASQQMEAVELGNTGVLWSWTIQSFCPKPPFSGAASPESFKPYGVGYIELPSGLKVESRLLENQPDQLAIGMPMILVLETLYTDEAGVDVVTFAFTATQAGREGNA